MKKTAKQVLFATLQEFKKSIEHKLIDGESTGEWLERPTHKGWWLWREGANSCRTELLLISTGGTHVAEDDAWENATDKPVEHDGWDENYWAGTDTTQKTMPGTWYELKFSALLKFAAEQKPPVKAAALLLAAASEEMERLENAVDALANPLHVLAHPIQQN